ncbi:MAG: GntR family transcriptional regulator [Spirochaetaceae bacterium]|nr:GntR family transcriptional regulator [Spirochaetaceae bacterium]
MFKHRQLYSSIQDKILSGAWYEGMLISSESQLCDIYQVSRITVRRALKELEDQHLVYKIQGKGTFVRASIKDVLDQPYSVSASTNIIYEVLESKVVKPKEKVSLALKLTKNEKEVYYIKRLRFRDDKPEAIINTWYRLEIGEKLVENDINHINSLSLLSIVSERQIVRVQTLLMPVNPSMEEARMLNLSITSAHSRIQRTAEFNNSEVAEYAEAFINSDDISFSISSWGKRDSIIID